MKDPASRERAGSISSGNMQACTSNLARTNTASQSNSRPRSAIEQLAEPVEIAKFWKNRAGEAVVVSLREYQGRALVDCRVNFTDPEGKLRPTSKGLALVVARLPDLARAVAKAHRKAVELGLIEGSS